MIPKETQHACHEVDFCLCSIIGLEPAEACPIHGAGIFPPRCVVCGKFMSWENNYDPH